MLLPPSSYPKNNPSGKGALNKYALYPKRSRVDIEVGLAGSRGEGKAARAGLIYASTGAGAGV